MHDHHSHHRGPVALDRHDHPHDHEGHDTDHPLGHNRPKKTAQWQVPHLPDGAAGQSPPELQDLDLVEQSFVESFPQASDPSSFLRLAGVPFVGVDATGRRLHLLRVEIESLTDIGSVSPLMGGHGVRYDPLPARLVSQRPRLGFIYHDGTGIVSLRFAQARALADESAPSEFAIENGRTG